MKTLFCLGAFFWVYFNCIGQTVTILEVESREPIPYAVLKEVGGTSGAVADEKGICDLSGFQEGSTIEVKMAGYETLLLKKQDIVANGGEILLEVNPFLLESTVVSAVRWKQDGGDLPMMVQSISSEDVALHNPQTAADLLGAGGRVFIQKSQQGGGSPMIRGFSTNRLLYAVDGVRMNTAIFRGGNLQNVISLDPFAIEATEVLFGPGSVMYGSDAIGGVMSFRTLEPYVSWGQKAQVRGKMVARYSSANQEKTAHFDVGVSGRMLSSVTSFSTFDFGDLRMGGHGPDEYLRPFYVIRLDSQDVVQANEDPRVQRPSGYSQVNLMQKVLFQPSSHWKFQYGFHYSETSDYGRYDRHIRYRNGQPRYGEWSYGPQIWRMHHLSANHVGRSGGIYDEMNLSLAAQYFEESRMDRDLNDAMRHVRTEKVDAYSINLDLRKQLGNGNWLYYGAEAVRNVVASSGEEQDILSGISVTGPSRYPQSTWNSLGVYASGLWRISEHLNLQGGTRYSRFGLDAVFDTTFYPFPYTRAELGQGALTGNLGLAWHPTSHWAISGHLSTGFRSPNVDDMGKVFDSEPGRVLVPNPDLDAEYAYNAEVDVAKVFGSRLKVDVVGFATLLDNALVRRPFTLAGSDSLVYDGTLSQVLAIQNAAVARVYGLQAGFELKLGQGWVLGSDLNVQIGEEELDDGSTSPSRHAPPLYGSTRLSFTTDKFHLQGIAQYSASRTYAQLPLEEQGKPEIYAVDENGNPWSPAWCVFHFKALYTLTDHLTASGGVENLTDLRYRPYSSGLVAPGRNVVVAMTVNF